MKKSEGIPSQDYFVKSQRIWFPDFDEVLEYDYNRYANYLKQPFTCMQDMIAFFRGELTRAQFISLFLRLEPPQKTLKKDHDAYLRTKAICAAYQDQAISAAEFDEQLLISFRNRPADDAFVPAVEQWEEITFLIARLTQKQNRLPIHFDGTGWNAYLTGRLTRKKYTEFYLTFGVSEHLAQVLIHERNKEDFAEKYALEISVCMRLHTLCLEYKEGKHSPDSFDAVFIELAKNFCEDVAHSCPKN